MKKAEVKIYQVSNVKQNVISILEREFKVTGFEEDHEVYNLKIVNKNT